MIWIWINKNIYYSKKIHFKFSPDIGQSLWKIPEYYVWALFLFACDDQLNEKWNFYIIKKE